MKHLALVAALLAAWPSVALADPHDVAPQDPRKVFAEGKRYFDVADYAHAIEAWKQAYVLSPLPILLFNIGQAYRLSNDCTNAMRFYANYEREQPNPANHDELADAKALCATAPVPAKPEPAPPPPQDTTPMTSAGLGSADLDREPAASTTAPSPTPAHGQPTHEPPPDPDAGHGLTIAGISTGVAGVALFVVGGVFASKASNDAGQISDYKGMWDTTHAGVQSSGQTDSTVAIAMTSAGAAGLVAGGVMLYLGLHRASEAHHVGVAITPSTTELTWSARF